MIKYGKNALQWTRLSSKRSQALMAFETAAISPEAFEAWLADEAQDAPLVHRKARR